MDNDEDVIAMAMGEDAPNDAQFEAMSEEELCAIVESAAAIARQENESGGTHEDRNLSLAYYNGQCPDLALMEGRSKMVSNDLRAVVAKVQPAVMRTFFSSPRVVEYVSDATDDADLVERIRDDINDDFIRKGGYAAFESAIFDSLIHDDGAIRYDIDGQTGLVTFEAIPPENVLITPDSRSEVGATLFGSWSRVTRSDLIERGYDPEKVNEAPMSGVTNAMEDIERRLTDVTLDLGDQSQDVDCYELFVRIDADGDGISELRRIVYIDKCTPETLLLNEPIARRRIFLVKAESRPHSARGRGLFRDVMDIQRAKTALLRAAMDNIAAVNDPTTVVDMSNVQNPEDLLLRKRGAFVLVDGMPQGGVLQTVPIPFTAQNCFEAMKYYDMALIDRTGVSGAASGMLPDVLQGQTATAVNMIQQGGTARVELICRNVAENSMRPMFEGIFLDLVEMFGIVMELKDTSINVGLGSGTRERDMMGLQNVMAIQEKLLAAYGPPETNPLVSFRTISNTLNKLVEVSGLRAQDTYFETPDDMAIEQRKQNAAQQPDPDQMKIQAQMQLEDKKMAVQRDKEGAQAEADVVVKRAEMEKDFQKMQMEGQHREMDANIKLQIEREKIASAEKIAFAKMEHDAMSARAAAGHVEPDLDDEGQPKPTQSEMMLQAITALADQVAQMQAVSLAPRVMTTPDGRTYTSQIATLN